jgi:hypothetical protein
MFLVPVNYLAVFLCAVAAMVIGFLWYGPLFGKQWRDLIGMTKGKMLEANKEMPKTYSLMFVSALLMAYALAHFVWYAAPGSLTLFISVKTALWAWIGFVATTSLTKFLFMPDRKPIQLLAIESGYYFATLVAMGIIFSLFA